ncbi:hypothetical protein [Paracidovorax wautersii]|uniref:Uncharacterized protein n=1 Tax=Paracidovorax wautersii TaxID=1177982 RepID=A0ABU1I8S3_9BURK|nr:hypothetical protein [Paracidovorax wautersii]MDR6213615.1 hypothetical protein [Paracidovorax wautersii]
MSAASLIATHLNAPYGKVVTAEDVIESLRSGHFAAASEEANGILEALFTEVSPDLILQCADQVGAPPEKVAHLYEMALELGVMRSPAWEDATSSVSRLQE